jgi:transcriptional regulator with XRE-family HTH domain
MLWHVPTTFGQNLKRLRGNTTQEELAAAADVAQSDVSKWERDKAYPPIPAVIRFAKILGCSVNSLLHGVDPEYDKIVIGLRDLPDHNDKRESILHKGGSVGTASAASSRIQQLERRIQEQEALMRQVQNVARTLFGLTRSIEGRSAGKGTTKRRQANRATG